MNLPCTLGVYHDKKISQFTKGVVSESSRPCWRFLLPGKSDYTCKRQKKVGAFVWIRGPKENPGQGTLIEGEDSVQLTSSLR